MKKLGQFSVEINSRRFKDASTTFRILSGRLFGFGDVSAKVIVVYEIGQGFSIRVTKRKQTK